MNILWFVFIGIIAGWLAGKIWQGSGFGCVGDLVVGILGAVVGGLVFGLLGLRSVGLIGNLVTATVGALILLYLLHKFGPNERDQY